MIKEAYCSYEVSKLLKEKGFDWETNWYYDLKGACEPFSAWVEAKPYEYSPMPTYQMACAWLREEKGIFFCVYPDYPISKNYMVEFYDNGVPSGVFGNYEDYNEAVEAALKFSLENLI